MATTMCLYYFNVTRAPGRFLVISAMKTDEQPWTFKWARVQCKTYPFIYNLEKISAARFWIRYAWADQWQFLGERSPKKWHGCIKTCARYFIHSFQIDTQNPHKINKPSSMIDDLILILRAFHEMIKRALHDFYL